MLVLAVPPQGVPHETQQAADHGQDHPAAGAQDPAGFPQDLRPFGNVVDAGDEADGIEGFIREGQDGGEFRTDLSVNEMVKLYAIQNAPCSMTGASVMENIL